MNKRLFSLIYTFFITCLWGAVTAKTHTFNFNVSYINANPDGFHERRVIAFNNEWPLPTIKVKKNDRVEILLTNQLENLNTSLHFHGIFQNGTNAMDGPEMVTQCPIPPGFTFLYNFTVTQSGTYWYHSHSGAQYGDGLRGLFVIEDEDDDLVYDEEVTLTVSDWYHEEYGSLTKLFLSRYNPTGAEPVPLSSLFNDTRNVTWNVRPDTTYLLRIANMALFASQYLVIEDHKFLIVEVDGVRVEPYETDSLYIAAAQRYSVLIRTKKDALRNYRFFNVFDQTMFDVLPDNLGIISTNWLRYNDGDLPKAVPHGPLEYDSFIKKINPVDDLKLKPISKTHIYEDHDYQVLLDFEMENLNDGVNYALFNGKMYVPPRVPTLLTVMTSGNLSSHAEIYGSNTNTFVLQKDEVIEIVLNNKDSGLHPFHLHGHNFQMLYRSEEGDDDNPIVYDPKKADEYKFPEYPSIRDTVVVNPNGFIIIRFKANNPGVWFFHCHVDWHLEQGLAITFVEAPEEIQKNQVIEPNHWKACKASKTPVFGNAAGNSGTHDEWHNLHGENVQQPFLPPGFTMKGYVALFICSVLALYGLYTIYKYGMEDIKQEDTVALLDKIESILARYNELDSDSSLQTNNNENSRLYSSPT